ncbi:MAG: LLM class flavin-dependent oxidoreductase, partial [Actinobacteria bacterium]|nr:LLM class flavin-dependent oxidoreductase [Actinomycetota bacterium]
MAQPVFLVRFDLRNPSFAGVTYAQRCAAALDMAQWADEHGAAAIVVSEHHGSDDGYLPSALTMAAAVAARTSRCTIYVSAIPAPLHDPVQLAEQVAVVEHLSGGRLVVVLANGYVPSELAMFDVEPRDRPHLLTEAVDVLRAARTGEPFEHRGRTIRITPAVGAPGRKGPPIVLGGSSDAAARRAARIADGFQPSDEGAWETYRRLRVEAGRRDPGPFVPDAGFVHL